MHCIKCGKNIPSDSKFCQFCGEDLNSITSREIDDEKLDSCQICGTKSPVKYNEFYANIGMLVARRQLSIRDNLCKSCINKYFWQYTFINLFLGWWGLISFFATIIFILNNVFRYISSITLKRYY